MTIRHNVLKIDKTAFSIGALHDDASDTAYWHSRTPEERLAALELMRQVLYGYNPSTTRLQRVLEITEFKRS